MKTVRIVSLLIAILFFNMIILCKSPSIELQISHSLDDTTYNFGLNFPTFTYCEVRRYTQNVHSALRFNMNVPSVTIVENAKIKMYLTEVYAESFPMIIQVFDYDDCPNFEENPFSWGKMDESVEMSTENLTVNGWSETVELKTIIQAWINRSETFPRHIGIEMKPKYKGDASFFRFHSYDGNTTHCAKLQMLYSYVDVDIDLTIGLGMGLVFSLIIFVLVIGYKKKR